MMKYTVEYTIVGCISVDAGSQEEASKIVHEMEPEDVLEKSDTYMMSIPIDSGKQAEGNSVS